ncbi:acetylcholinesterase-1-like protein, partial [Dinothrombium tinctorium]
MRRAILQSGSPFYPQVLENQDLSLKRALQFVEKAGCVNKSRATVLKPNSAVACLQKLDAYLLAKINDEMIDGFQPPFGVTLGNDFLPRNPYQAIHDIDFFNQHEILIGSTRDEGSFFLHWTFPEIFDISAPKNVSVNDAIKLIEIAFKSVPD